MLNKWILSIIITIMLVFSTYGYIMDWMNSESHEIEQEPESEQVLEAGYIPKLVDNNKIYEQDKPDHVDYLYITVMPGNLKRDKPVTWSDINKQDYTWDNTNDPELDILIQEGTAEGPAIGMFAYSETEANAFISIRGNSSRRAMQKSYKVDLYDQAGYWQNQKVINLVKHAGDVTRIRNKLSFDYMTAISNMTSLRTRFVNVYVKDLTANPVSKGFVDYGLYEQIEQPNKLFLRSHGLDPFGHLYKPISFEFLRYKEALKLKDDPSYNKAAFEQILEIKGDDDHTKLIRMLEDINNMSINFDEVFDQHFDRDNFLTWTAMNILFDNKDTISQNFMLYSPLNSNTWFFLPWDYDAAWGYYEGANPQEIVVGKWNLGIANYWGNTLQKRFFKNPHNVEQLNAKLDELLKMITPERTQAMIDQYRTVVDRFVGKQPDIQYLSGTLAEYEQTLHSFPNLPLRNRDEYYKNLDNPMPFFLGEVAQQPNQLHFVWDHSYDLQGDDLSYHFQVSTDPLFTHIVVDHNELKSTEMVTKLLPEGTYFWRVTAKDHKGNTQEAFDLYADKKGLYYHGVRTFTVTQ